eukprot:354470-Chlamydomonas_euryale.AAC.37
MHAACMHCVHCASKGGRQFVTADAGMPAYDCSGEKDGQSCDLARLCAGTRMVQPHKPGDRGQTTQENACCHMAQGQCHRLPEACMRKQELVQ